MTYDLEKRTTDFSKNILTVCRKIKINQINRNIIDQLIRSATSIGANYCEANGASSRNDFRNKIHICKKEAQETRYWLELLGHTETSYKEDLLLLQKEAQELSAIFGKISVSVKKVV